MKDGEQEATGRKGMSGRKGQHKTIPNRSGNECKKNSKDRKLKANVNHAEQGILNNQQTNIKHKTMIAVSFLLFLVLSLFFFFSFLSNIVEWKK